MRQWSFETGFGYDNLVLGEADTPRPGPRGRAAGDARRVPELGHALIND